MPLPTDSKARKDIPMASGVLDYFPDALAAVAEVSVAGNLKHNPGQPLHWSKGKSDDHADALLRHLVDRGKFDEIDIGGGNTVRVRHSAEVAWRSLANLQTEIELEQEGNK
jgi:dATP/dGTP diphosphohydrolase, N-terminal